MHVGTVVAGVLGARTPTFDVWGPVVNMASRLESTGAVGRLQVSERVADEYAATPCRHDLPVVFVPPDAQARRDRAGAARTHHACTHPPRLPPHCR